MGVSQKSEWPEGIKFQDAVTCDAKGRRFSRPPTHVYTVTGGAWGYTDEQRASITAIRYVGNRKTAHQKTILWKAKEIAALKLMFERKYPVAAMTKKLHRFSEQAIRNQLMRLGLSIKTRDGTKTGRNSK